jgi:carboxyl-terminal processing protease
VAKRLIWLAVLWVPLGLAQNGLGAEESKPPASAAPDSADPSRQSQDEYYELFSLLVDTIDQVERNYVQKLSRRDLVEAAIGGILHKLDPYSNYIAPEDITRFRTSVENQFGGIGIQVTLDGTALKIVTPLVGSPAYRAGLHAGDRITEIEGESTEGLSIDEAVKKLKGEIGSQVRLAVQSPGQPPRPVTLTREMVHLETVLGDVRSDDDQWNYLIDAGEKIAYIRLTGFSRDTAAELRQTLCKLKNDGMRGLILDLRFNPGGLLSSAIEVSDLFVSEGTIVSTEGRNTEPRVWKAHAEDTFEGFPLAVLVNRFSASSSEIVAACLQDHKRAVILGERTWGKGSVQNVVELEGGRSALKLTTASYKRPSGKNIHRFPQASEKDEWGVVPDEGFALRLSDDELEQLIEYRRQRDVVRPKRDAQDTQQVAANVPSKPPVEPAKPATPESASDAKSKDEGANPPAGETSTGQASDKQAPTAASGRADAVDPPARRFVDRQLQKALDYIKSELAKTK